MNFASIVVAVVNAVWQGAAIVAVVAIVLRLLRRVNAATACAVWTATFATIALLPAVDFLLQRSVVEKVPAPVVAVAAAPAWDVAGPPVLTSRIASVPVKHAARGSVNAIRPSVVTLREAPRAQRVPAFNAQKALLSIAAGTSWFAERIGAAVIGTWALIALYLLVNLVRDYAALRRVKRHATPVERSALAAVPRRAAGRRIRVCASDRIRIPCAAGFFHPVVLLPTALAEGLSDADLVRVVLHEVGHLQRFDDWLHAGERVLRALFFFQPALWYAGSRISFERELACDDRVLATTGEPIGYAECLTNIVERNVLHRRGLVPVLGFLLGRNQVVGRIARLVDRGRNGSIRIPRTAALVTCASLALAVGIMLPLQLPLFAACRDEVRAANHLVHRLTHPFTVARHARPAVVVAAHVHCPSHPAAIAAVRSKGLHAHVVQVARVAPVAPAKHVARVAQVARVVRTPVDAGVLRRAAVLRATESSGDADAVVAVAPAPLGVIVPAVHLMPHVVRRSNDLLDALSEAGLHPSVDDLIEMHNRGVSADFLHAIADSGIAKPTVGDVLAMADKGLTRPIIVAAVAAFGSAIPLHDIVSLRDAGVTPDYLYGLAPLKSQRLSVVETVGLAQNGVTPAFIAAVEEAGYVQFDAQALVRLHDNGVDASFLKLLARRGLRHLPVGRILELHDNGVSS